MRAAPRATTVVEAAPLQARPQLITTALQQGQRTASRQPNVTSDVLDGLILCVSQHECDAGALREFSEAVLELLRHRVLQCLGPVGQPRIDGVGPADELAAAPAPKLDEAVARDRPQQPRLRRPVLTRVSSQQRHEGILHDVLGLFWASAEQQQIAPERRLLLADPGKLCCR